MKSLLRKRIHSSVSEAHAFFVDSYRQDVIQGGLTISGFPETKGKKRITEWGGTSAAIAALRAIGNGSALSNTITADSSEWLLSQRNPQGAWEASGIHLAEATAGVLLDLDLPAGDPIVTVGIDFLRRCFRANCYYSTVLGSEVPHLYTTFLVMRCLAKYSGLEHVGEIQQWILSSVTKDGHWGQTPNSNVSTPLHTIFALHILNYCGTAWPEIQNTFRPQIGWIKSSFLKSDYIYEEIEVQQPVVNAYGHQYKRLRLRHYVLPYAGGFFLQLPDHGQVLFITERVLDQQFAGGWGPSNDELTMWATHQSVLFLQRVRASVLPKVGNLQVGLAKLPRVTHIRIRVGITVVALLLSAFFLFTPEYRPNLIVSAFMLFVTWLIKWG